MNIDLPMDQLETMPGTPAEPADPISTPTIRDALRKHLTTSQSFINRNLISRTSPSAATSPRVEYAIDPDVSIV